MPPTEQPTAEEKGFEGWALLELMGHRKMAGRLTEVTIGGGAFIRIDVFSGKDKKAMATQFYRPDAVYCITPTTEEIARAYAQKCQPEPVTRYELPEMTPSGRKARIERMEPGVDFEVDG